jgi:hypothetical protein
MADRSESSFEVIHKGLEVPEHVSTVKLLSEVNQISFFLGLVHLLTLLCWFWRSSVQSHVM